MLIGKPQQLMRVQPKRSKTLNSCRPCCHMFCSPKLGPSRGSKRLDAAQHHFGEWILALQLCDCFSFRGGSAVQVKTDIIGTIDLESRSRLDWQ